MTLVLSPRDVRDLLPMPGCIDLMATALETLARGDAVQPLRQGIRLPDNLGLLGMMPGYLGRPRALGLKAVAVFPGNHGTGYDAHQGIVLLFELEHGTPIAILDASEITAIRTAAATGVATRLLARDDVRVLALVGTGVQGRTHLEAMLAVRPFEEVRVFSRTANHRQTFAERETARHGIPVHAVDSVKDAVQDADVICTTTSAREPVLAGAWIAPGTHVNAVGSSIRSTRELDTEAVARSRLFVDRKESTVNEAGDFLFPLAEGAITEEHIVAEIGDLLVGAHPGRTRPDEITLFKSLGLAVEDLAAAQYVYDAARQAGRGVEVDLGGRT